jgi:hypothetical protein
MRPEENQRLIDCFATVGQQVDAALHRSFDEDPELAQKIAAFLNGAADSMFRVTFDMQHGAAIFRGEYLRRRQSGEIDAMCLFECRDVQFEFDPARAH